MMGMVCLMLKDSKGCLYIQSLNINLRIQVSRGSSESSKWGQFAGYEKKSVMKKKITQTMMRNKQ